MKDITDDSSSIYATQQNRRADYVKARVNQHVLPALWQIQRFTENRFHALFKFRRMRGAEEQAIFAWIQLVTQRTIRYGSVRPEV